MHIPFSALDKQHQSLLPELLAVTKDVFSTAEFVLGKPVLEFEKKFADYHGSAFAIGVNSGTDALILALRALDIGAGDEVITTANTFITTVSSIALTGATPVLVDTDDHDNIQVELIEKHITAKTKAILPVHWTGKPCAMEKIIAIAKKYNLKIIEDCAQAVSASYKNKMVGTFGVAGCFSLHPYKTLNACGDAGVIICNDAALAEKIRALRQNGLNAKGECHYWSNNSRLDTLQAAILNVKLQHFEKWTERRIEIANYYTEQLTKITEVTPPKSTDSDYRCVFHTYIVKAKDRDTLKAYLLSQGIETRIHYQTPIYRQPIAQKTLTCQLTDFPNMEHTAQHALSLPIYPELSKKEQDYIIDRIQCFYHSAVTTTQNTNNPLQIS